MRNPRPCWPSIGSGQPAATRRRRDGHPGHGHRGRHRDGRKRVQVGAAGFAGEIGHMVVDPAGPPCALQAGTWRLLGALRVGAPVWACKPVRRRWRGRLGEVVKLAGGDPESVRGEDVSAAARARRGGARQQVIEEVGWWIGFGLANLAAAARPGVASSWVAGVVQAGGRPCRVGACHDLFADPRRGSRSSPSWRWSYPLPSGRGSVLGLPWARRLRRTPGRTCGDADGCRAADVCRDTPRRGVRRRHVGGGRQGWDGVFCWKRPHLAASATPEQPALAPFPLLLARWRPCSVPPGTAGGGAPFLGTLVAGGSDSSPTRCWPPQFLALEREAGPHGRVMSPELGTGDRLSEEEKPRLRDPLRACGRAAGRDGRAGAGVGRNGAPGVDGRGTVPGGGRRRPGQPRSGPQPVGCRARAGGRARQRAPHGLEGDLGRATAFPRRRRRLVRDRLRSLRRLARGHLGRVPAGRSTSRSWPRRRRSVGTMGPVGQR